MVIATNTNLSDPLLNSVSGGNISEEELKELNESKEKRVRDYLANLAIKNKRPLSPIEFRSAKELSNIDSEIFGSLYQSVYVPLSRGEALEPEPTILSNIPPKSSSASDILEATEQELSPSEREIIEMIESQNRSTTITNTPPQIYKEPEEDKPSWLEGIISSASESARGLPEAMIRGMSKSSPKGNSAILMALGAGGPQGSAGLLNLPKEFQDEILDITNLDMLEGMENINEYFNQVTQEAPIASTFIGYAFDPLLYAAYGPATRAKTVFDMSKYGVVGGAAHSGMRPVLEGETWGGNVVEGGIFGGIAFGGFGLARRAWNQRRGKEPFPLTQAEAAFTKKQQPIEELRNEVIKGIKVTQPKPNRLDNKIKSFYTRYAGNPLWDWVSANPGRTGMTTFGGIAGWWSADDEATIAQKMTSTAFGAMAGFGIHYLAGIPALTSAISKRVGLPDTERSLNDILAKGFINEYMLPSVYREYKDIASVNVRSLSDQFYTLAKESTKLSPEDRRLLGGIISGEFENIPKNMNKLSAEAIDLIKETGQKMVDVGLLSEEVFLKNAGRYAHRTYLKHLKGLVDDTTYKNSTTMRIIGDVLRPRGRIETTTSQRKLKELQKEGYELLDKTFRDKRTVTVKNYKENFKTYEILQKLKGGKIIIGKPVFKLRKDFTKSERQQLGEIEDAAYKINETGRLMTNDLSMYQLFDDIAKDRTLAITAEEFAKNPLKNWKQVSAATIKDTSINRYGNLAGKYVPEEIYNDIIASTYHRDFMRSPAGRTYLKMLSVWKKSKTAWNPAVHMNNTLSNVILYDYADASYRHLYRGAKAIIEGEANPVYRLMAREGVFESGMVNKELNMLGDQLQEEMLRFSKNLANPNRNPTVSTMEYAAAAEKPAIKKFNLLPIATGTKDALGVLGDVTFGGMTKLYGMEDQIFRAGVFLDRLSKGQTVRTAAKDARRWFIDYDINAPAINALRYTATPFLSYTYRVVPLLAETATLKPWKVAKWAGLAYGLNKAGSYWGPGNEEAERLVGNEKMRETLYGLPGLPYTTMKTPFISEEASRLAGTQIPSYIDITRWIPGGDVFALSGATGAEGWLPGVPAPLQPSFGLVGEAAIPLVFGKDAFTKKGLKGLGVNSNIDWQIKWDHFVHSLQPNIPVDMSNYNPINLAFGSELNIPPFLPSHSSNKINEAFANHQSGEGKRTGQDFSPLQAILQSMGVKVSPFNIESAEAGRVLEMKQVYKASQDRIFDVLNDINRDRISSEKGQELIEQIEIDLVEEMEKLEKGIRAAEEKGLL